MYSADSGLTERQYASAGFSGPVEGQETAMNKFEFAGRQRLDERGATDFRRQWFAAEEDNTRFRSPGVCEDPREIQVVCNEYVFLLAGEIANFLVRR